MKYHASNSLYLATFIPPSVSSPLAICSSSEPRRTSSWESGKSRIRESELQHICTRASRPTSDSISKLPSEKQEPAAEENEASTVEPPEVLESDWASASSRHLTLYIFFDCWDGRLKFEFRGISAHAHKELHYVLHSLYWIGRMSARWGSPYTVLLYADKRSFCVSDGEIDSSSAVVPSSCCCCWFISLISLHLISAIPTPSDKSSA